MISEEFKSVNLSRIHDGQICQPVLEYRRVRKGVYHVQWRWVDLSTSRDQEGRIYARGEILGNRDTCERAIKKAGIHTDDSYAPF
jgi:hypothetical protein